MKRMLTFTVCAFLTAQAFAQTGGKTTTHKTSSAGAVMNADKSKMLCKAWKLDSTEEFGVIHAASAKEKTDGITFVADGNYFNTTEGVATTGTWKGTGNPYVNTATGTPEVKMMYKIISLSDTKLVLEYQTEDLIRIKYAYSPK